MPPSVSPPRALRVLHLPDRLVLHDVTPALRHADPSDRNALIDAVNAVHTRHLSGSDAVAGELAAAPTLSLIDLDLPTPPAGATASDSAPRRDRYLVLPFAPEKGAPATYITSSQEQAGVSLALANTLVVDAAAGLLGVLRLPSARYAVLATQARRAGSLPAGTVYCVSRVKLVRLSALLPVRDDKELINAIAKMLDGGALYYALDTDLTRSTQRSSRQGSPNAFWWTWPLAERLGEDGTMWALRTVYGFVGTQVMRFQSKALPTGTGEFNLTLVSRRSRRRAGTRYITRGVDAMGDVANFVETEQIAWCEERPSIYTSFVIIRGSVPVFWRQNNGIARPVPELDGKLTASRAAFAAHFDVIMKNYGGVSAVSLVDKHGSESVLADVFERHFNLDLRNLVGPLAPRLVAFDFHSHCGGKEYERGLALLLERVKQDIELFGIFARGLEATGKNASQMGVFRVNCVDCLDRTNVVQSLISRVALNMQLEAIFGPDLLDAGQSAAPRFYGESEDRFKHIWGDNADAVSKQYSGTGALKTDFTRTGKRSTTGVIGDGMKSVMRMYYKNFVDEGRQEVIDIVCGNALIRPPPQLTATKSIIDVENMSLQNGKSDDLDPVSSPLWYSFEALRVNAGGDKQTVFVELHDDAMFVTTTEGVSLEYPRHALASWSKYEDEKTSDKKSPVRLRLVYHPSRKAPATASPLDLQFKSGPTARENFLRALVSWAKPEASSLLCRQEVRVRVIAALNAGEHRMNEWGLDCDPGTDHNEIVVLVLPEGNAVTRSWGLAAVPLDVDESGYILVSACAVTDRGPAIAVLVSKKAAPTVMSVAEATSGRTSSFSAGGAVAVALQACGTSFCFVSGRLSGSTDVYHALTSLKLGRQSFDVTNQFHHFVLAGLLGDMHWHHDFAPGYGRDARKWVRLGDGAACYSLGDGLSVMRNSFPTLDYVDQISPESVWRVEDSPRTEVGSMTCIELADGLVEGRPGPSLPRAVSQCVVTISDIRGYDIKTPPGVDQNSQLNSQVVLFCEYSTVDGVASRQTARPTPCPEWHESLRLVMMPVDPEEVHESFVMGQIVLPTPLADAIPAGHFVIPISCSREGRAKFDVPCRLAGIPTGRLSGIIEMQVGGPELLENIGQMKSVKSSRVGGTDASRAKRNGLPPIPGQRVEESVNRSNQDALSRRPRGSSAFSSSRAKKPSMDEVSEKLDAARRKGSKQIKSVVTRLSSLLNQPSSSSDSSTRISDRGYGGGLEDDSSQSEGFKELVDDGFGEPSLPFRAADMERSTITRGTSEPRLSTLGNTRGPPTHRVASYQGRPTSHGQTPLDLVDSEDFSAFGGFQAAPVRRPMEKAAVSLSEDPLLNGLKASAVQSRKAPSQPGKVPVHAQNTGVDLLLSGLADEKTKIHAQTDPKNDDDGWGDFEAAGNVPAASAKHSNMTNSHLDF